jgi:hypothetical protein
MYRETKDPKYLEQAHKIAAFILHNPNLPADKIPYWDYSNPVKNVMLQQVLLLLPYLS